jgi:hypothetical protein
LALLFCVLHPRQSLLFMSLHKMESTLLIHSCSYTGHRAVVCDVSDLASVASPSSGLLHPSSQSASALRLKDTNIRNTQHSPKGAVKWTSALQSSFDITPSRPLQVKGLQSCIDTSFFDAVDAAIPLLGPALSAFGFLAVSFTAQDSYALSYTTGRTIDTPASSTTHFLENRSK